MLDKKSNNWLQNLFAETPFFCSIYEQDVQ